MKLNAHLNSLEVLAISLYESDVRYRDLVTKPLSWYDLRADERNTWRDRAIDMASEIRAHYG